MTNSKFSDAALMIFVKNAELGKVKTRLASTVGDEQALKIYLALLDHTRKIAESLPVDRLLFYSRFIDREDKWPADKFQKHIQSGDDLGERMVDAFQRALVTYRKVIIVGSDCAGLSTEIVEQAFSLLEHHDFVVGPAIDGGYYLLGMKQLSPSLFREIEWSTEKVYTRTVERIEALEASYGVLPALSDIDRAEDWEKYGWPLD